MGADEGATGETGTDAPDGVWSVVAGLRSNPHVLDVTTTLLLDPEECDAIVAGLDTEGWEQMTVLVPGDGTLLSRGATLADVRRGRQRPLPGGDAGALAARVSARVLEVNRDVYRFRVSGFESLRILWYSEEEQGHYVTHTDLGPATSLRKLSFSVLLSDPDTYTGGDLCFGSPFPLARQQGTLTVFPSFLPHAVEPVTAGNRFAIVGFVVGPTFS